MEQGPVPEGESVADDDAMTAQYAADQMPDWLDEDLPPDFECGDEWERPSDAAEVAAQAEADGAAEAAATARLIAEGVETTAAHVPGAPMTPGIKAGPAGGFGQSEPLDTAGPEPALECGPIMPRGRPVCSAESLMTSFAACLGLDVG